jgi:hypothetical protein
MKALIVREPWIDLILDGQKTWELRTQPTSIRGLIALIRKGSRQIDGVATLVDVLPRLTEEGLSDSFEFHHVYSHRHQEVVEAGWLTPWVLLDAQRFSAPVPFVRPPGAVTWVDLDVVMQSAVDAATEARKFSSLTSSALAPARISLAERMVADHPDVPVPDRVKTPQISPALEVVLVRKAEELGFNVKHRNPQTKMLQFSIDLPSGPQYVFVDRMPKSDPHFRVFLPPQLDGRLTTIVEGIPGVQRFRNARSGHSGFRHSAFRVFSGYHGQEPEANGWLLPEVSGDTAFASVLLAVKAIESRAA